MKTTASMRLSVSLQGIASQIEDALTDAAGERVGWVLMVNADDVTQYVSNCGRQDGVGLIESLLARWKAGRADIPAHMNPDLPRAK